MANHAPPPAVKQAPAAHTALPLYLALAYTLLVIYASLHPFSDWRGTGESPFSFLSAAWPRYWTTFDLSTNLLAYFPLGFLWVPALQTRCHRTLAVLLAILLGAGASFGLETLQNYLPNRVPSNVDFACNSLGAFFGALIGARWGATLLDGGHLHALRVKLVGHGASADAGLVLLGLWLLTQLNPEILLFGNGDLRGLLELLGMPHNREAFDGIDISGLPDLPAMPSLPTPLPYNATRFPWVEAVITATNTLVIGLIASCLLRVRRRQLPFLFVTLALLIKSFSLTLLMSDDGFSWATSGNLAGLCAGGLLWWLTAKLSNSAQQALAAPALLLATILVNLAPENPYLTATLQVWQQGHFLNFNGLTRWTSALWPFLALPWLILLRQEKSR